MLLKNGSSLYFAEHVELFIKNFSVPRTRNARTDFRDRPSPNIFKVLSFLVGTFWRYVATGRVIRRLQFYSVELRPRTFRNASAGLMCSYESGLSAEMYKDTFPSSTRAILPLLLSPFASWGNSYASAGTRIILLCIIHILIA